MSALCFPLSANSPIQGERSHPTVPQDACDSGGVDLIGAIQQAGHVFCQRVMQGKGYTGRVGLALALSVGTALCTAVGIVVGLLAVVVQAMALPIFLVRGPRTWEAFKHNCIAIGQEAAAVGLAVATACLCPPRPEIRADDASPCIVMIHGYAHSGAAWLYCQGALQKRGLTAVALDWGHPLQSLEGATTRIREQITALGLPATRPILAVGHSTGGVIAQRLLAEGAVQGIVTVGAPHTGTPLAVLAPGRCMRQMSPSSHHLEQVNSREDVRLAPRSLVRATMDLLVPAESALLLEDQIAYPTEPRTHRCCGASGGHISLLYSPRVVTIIEQTAARILPQSP